MENREHVIADYFRLRVLLNKTNVKSNEKTDIELVISKEKNGNLRLFATLKGAIGSKRLEICSKILSRTWRSSGYSGLSDLETFCVQFLGKKLQKSETIEDLKICESELNSELRSLGIRS